ncbi:MAG: alpha-amylase family glycosyl hydrolase [Sumerlaeia bacterium]
MTWTSKLLAPLAAACLATAAPAEDLPWWNDAVFYQIFVRSFQDSQTGPLANDGIGDIQGMIDRLDYLNDGDPNTTDDLGVRGLWLLPMSESVHPAGYSVVDYETIEHDYGTNADFRRFIDEAHARGIRVIVDLVLNHSSIQHPWFLAAGDPNSHYHDFYVWSDSQPTDQGDRYARQWNRHDNGKWFFTQFGRGIPDLNVENPVVKEKLYQIAKFWLEDMNVDGFRLDAIKHLIEDGPVDEHTEATHAWLREFQAYCKSIKPDCYIVGEVWSGTEAVAKYETDQIDMCFQFELAGAIISAAGRGHRGDLPAKQTAVVAAHAPLQVAPFLSNHDMMRVMEQLDRHPGKMRAAAAMLLTAPGVPFVYYGEEVGISGHDGKGRSPMQWSTGEHAGFSTVEPYRPLEDEWQRFSVEAQESDRESVLAGFRELIHFRNDEPPLRAGDYAALQVNPPTLTHYVIPKKNDPAVFGYSVLNDGVEFVFDPALYESITKEGSNEQGAFSPEAIESVSVAGDFNAWTPGSWMLTAADDGTYRLKKENWAFSLENHEFKFVLNEDQWLEPPAHKPNRKHAGMDFESYNLVLSRTPGQSIEGCEVAGGRVTFSFDPALGRTHLRRDSGEATTPTSIESAVVVLEGAGDASPIALSPAADGTLRSESLSLADLPAREFRVLVNGDAWAEPSASALNAKPAAGGSPIYAFLRSVPGETLLCLINPSDAAQDTYSVFGGKLPEGRLAAADAMTGESLPVPEVAADGQIQPYQPFASLEPFSYRFVRLTHGGAAQLAEVRP